MSYLHRLAEHEGDKDDLSEGKCIVLYKPEASKTAQGKRGVAIKDYSAAILRQDPRCFLKGTSTLFLDGNCYICAYYNRLRCYAGLGLKLVCGSLGFGKEHPRWLLFGKRHYVTAKDFMNGHPLSWDWHVWLENEEGCVWDVLPGMWHTLAHALGRHLGIGSAEEDSVIEGLARDILEKEGLEYIPASEATQSILFSVAERWTAPYFKALQLDQ